MRVGIARLAFALIALMALDAPRAANAQDRKKAREPNAASQPATTGGPSCNGMLWVGSTCRMPDGRRCEVAAGTSGNAVFINCK